MNDLKKWKKAVVHIESVTDIEEHTIKQSRLLEELLIGTLTPESYLEQITGPMEINDARVNGTALFLMHNQKRYLITARHVIENEFATISLRERNACTNQKTELCYYGKPHLL